MRETHFLYVLSTKYVDRYLLLLRMKISKKYIDVDRNRRNTVVLNQVRISMTNALLTKPLNSLQFANLLRGISCNNYLSNNTAMYLYHYTVIYT